MLQEALLRKPTQRRRVVHTGSHFFSPKRPRDVRRLQFGSVPFSFRTDCGSLSRFCEVRTVWRNFACFRIRTIVQETRGRLRRVLSSGQIVKEVKVFLPRAVVHHSCRLPAIFFFSQYLRVNAVPCNTQLTSQQTAAINEHTNITEVTFKMTTQRRRPLAERKMF